MVDNKFKWDNANALLVQIAGSSGTNRWIRDETANDSDKTFVVPAGKQWILRALIATLATSATVGNRVLTAALYNEANKIVYAWAISGNCAASSRVGIRLCEGSALSTTLQPYAIDGFAGSVSVSVIDNIPMGMIIPAGYYIRVWDRPAIDAAADDLTVSLNVIESDAPA